MFGDQTSAKPQPKFGAPVSLFSNPNQSSGGLFGTPKTSKKEQEEPSIFSLGGSSSRRPGRK